jgi:hypothetical protein
MDIVASAPFSVVKPRPSSVDWDNQARIHGEVASLMLGYVLSVEILRNVFHYLLCNGFLEHDRLAIAEICFNLSLE